MSQISHHELPRRESYFFSTGLGLVNAAKIPEGRLPALGTLGLEEALLIFECVCERGGGDFGITVVVALIVGGGRESGGRETLGLRPRRGRRIEATVDSRTDEALIDSCQYD